jgi:ssDNA-binding Zn-finger/Zn-ribbon topoisomerase 1
MLHPFLSGPSRWTFQRRNKMAKAGGKKTIAQVNYCKCGGIVSMHAILDGGLKYHAECPKCGARARRPSLLK